LEAEAGFHARRNCKPTRTFLVYGLRKNFSGYSFYDGKESFSIPGNAKDSVTIMRRVFPLLHNSYAIAALLCLVFLNGCVISPRRTVGGGSGGGGTSTGGKLYVTSGNSILRFDNALSATGNIAPGGTITGTSTALSSPHALQIDTGTDRLYVANQGGGSVLIFSAASTLTGNVAPSATVGGGATGLSSPVGVAVDNTRDLLYVADGTSISVFTGASSLSGTVNTTPTQSFIAGFTISGIFVDGANNILYATDAADNTIAIYQSANAQSGVGFAGGTIVGPDTGLSQPTGVVLDPGGRLIVSNPGVPNLTAFPNPTVASGDVLPVAVIKGGSTGLSSPAQMASTNSITNGALYVADSRASTVLIYSPISNVTGTVNLAPSRQLSGATTTLSSPTGIALDSTR
jgi:hypothetical protein